MAIPVPNLDDRHFQDLVDEAKRRIPRYCPTWTDHNVSDPGITLVELFAWMTEQYLFRLNQVPDKNYITFLNLIGMQLEPATPAKGDVTFTLAAAATPERHITIPAGTEVATERTEAQEAIVFTTDRESRVHAALLRWLLTDTSDAGYQDRSQVLRDAAQEDGRDASFEIWGNPPVPSQHFYFGFDQDLSAHTIVLQVRCDKVGIGIDPDDPPWQWEAWRGSELLWEQLPVLRDTTAGLNQNGEIQLILPYQCQPQRLPPYEAATVIRCAPIDAPRLGQAPYARSPRIHHVSAYSIGITVPVTHALPIGPEVLGISSGEPGQKFQLQNRDILKPEGAEEVIQVAAPGGGWENWQQVSDFGESRPRDKHYTLDPITGEVEFGPVIRQRDGTEPNFGAIPPRLSTVRMRRYRVGGGVRGNVAEGRVKILKSTLPYVTAVENRTPITGGAEAQSLDDAKLRAPARLRTRYRAVTADDFEYLAQEVEGIGRVRCLQPLADDASALKPGTVALLVIPDLPTLKDAELDRQIDLHEALARQDQRVTVETKLRKELELPDGTAIRLREFLDQRRLLTTRVEIRAPEYVWVTVQARVKAEPKAEPERVRRAVKYELYRYLHPLFGGPERKGWIFGQPLTIDKVYALIQKIPGVEYATELKLIPIDIHNPTGKRLGETQQVIDVPANGVIVSYYHNVYLEQ
jgi:predicted phage baseplate assembly protein